MERRHLIRKKTRIDMEILREVTNLEQERNIYIHPNALARDIFWQRLEWLYRYLLDFTSPADRLLDLGGGSGAFLQALSGYFHKVDLLDLDPSDARAIIDRLSLANVEVFSGDMTTFRPDHRYDVIIMADVLEHFEDTEVPLQCVKRLFSVEGGTLIVSLPTENWLYLLGRLVVRKQKPVDHYHSSREVLDFLQEHELRLVARRYSPQYCGIRLPLFDIAVFEFAGIPTE